MILRNVNDPPTCSNASASKTRLWPPNHKLVPVTIKGLTDPDDDELTIQILAVTQDEPILGTGSGDTSPDAVIDGQRVLIRAERDGNGNGRVYTVHFQATDEFNQTCTGSVTIEVPHSNRKGSSASNDGQIYDSTQP